MKIAAGNRKLSRNVRREDRWRDRLGDGDRRGACGLDGQGGHRVIDRLMPGPSSVEAGLGRRRFYGVCGGEEVDHGALVAQTESLASNSFCALVSSLIEVARGGFFVVLLRGVISEESIRPSRVSSAHAPTRPITAFVGANQVRQSSASSFETMPVEPMGSQNTTVSGDVHER